MLVAMWRFSSIVVLVAGCGGGSNGVDDPQDGGLPDEGVELPPGSEGPFAIEQARFGGEGFYGVELDGYGLPAEAHWTSGESLASVNPRISPEMPDWYDDHGAPVAYVAGASPTIDLIISAPDEAPGEWHVRGAAALGETSLVFEGAAEVVDGVLEVSVDTSGALPGAIAHGALSIDWSVAPDGFSTEGVSAGTLSVPLYVLRAEPIPDCPLLHTPVHVSCEAAEGMEDAQDVIDAVWARFATRDVQRARDGWSIQYYGRHHRAPGEFRAMLVAGAGQCTTMAYLMHAALGVHGIASDITGVFPAGGLGRIFVGPWASLDGAVFMGTGPDGICDSTAAGDDEQAVAVGQGRPWTRAVNAATPPMGTLEGDDGVWFGSPTPGGDGVVDTPIANHAGAWVSAVPLDFGLPQQRAYHVTGDPDAVVLGGDDVIRQQLTSVFVLTGYDGINDTELQAGIEDSGPGVFPIPVGHGTTSININAAFPIHLLAAGTTVGGDDVAYDGFQVQTGPDGIADTAALGLDDQVIPVGQGMPDVPCVGPGIDGVLDTIAGGDDEIIDISPILAYAPADYLYVRDVNLWSLQGPPGQSADQPPPDFPNHVILSVAGTLYDPSYGTGPFASHADWEAVSLSADGVIVRDDQDRLLGTVAKTVGRLSGASTMLPPH